MTLTETKPKKFKPLMFGHTYMPNLRGMSIGESHGIEPTKELIKPLNGKDDLPRTSI